MAKLTYTIRNTRTSNEHSSSLKASVADIRWIRRGGTYSIIAIVNGSRYEVCRVSAGKLSSQTGIAQSLQTFANVQLAIYQALLDAHRKLGSQISNDLVQSVGKTESVIRVTDGEVDTYLTEVYDKKPAGALLSQTLRTEGLL